MALPRRFPGSGRRRPAKADLLHHAARDQAAHRMGHQVYLGRPGLLADEHDQVIQPGRRRFDAESVGRDVLMDPPEHALDHVLVRWRHEGGSGLIVEPVDRQGPRKNAPVTGVEQILVLITVHEQLVTLIGHQAQQRPLELIKYRIAVSAGPDMSGPGVEPVKRIVYGDIDSGRRPRIPSHVYNWQPVHAALPGPLRDSSTGLVRPQGFIPNWAVVHLTDNSPGPALATTGGKAGRRRCLRHAEIARIIEVVPPPGLLSSHIWSEGPSSGRDDDRPSGSAG